MNQKIFAVVLTWNNYLDTKECIESLRESSRALDGIVIVDNGSQDGSIEYLKKDFKDVSSIHFIHNPENYGFAKGMNIGIRYVLTHGADHVFLLNNDAVADRECVGKLCLAMVDDPSIGVAGPRIFYYNTPQRIWHGGGYFSWIKTGPVVPEKNLYVEKCNLRNQPVSFLTGCAVLIRREALEKVGLFDEDYFLYAEDLDFCLRVIRQGFKLIYVPEAKTWHKISPKLEDRTSPLVMYHLARSRIIFLRKNFPSWYFAYGFLIHCIIYTPFRIIQAFRSKNPLEAIRAWFHGAVNGF